VFGIQPPDKCDGLRSGAECPFARLVSFGGRERLRVIRRGLVAILNWMTTAARLGSGVRRG
jgi:hypothetical protein